MMKNLSNEQKYKLIKLLLEMGHQSLWEISTVEKWLNDIGIQTKIIDNETALIFYDEIIKVKEPEWGEAGIHAPSIAYVIAKKENINASSNYTGYGYRYRHLLDKISKHWGLETQDL